MPSHSVSKSNVSKSPRLLRWLKYGAVSLLLAILCAVIAIHVQERILRDRAERLLVDIRSLELRKASFTQAQAVFRRWSRWGHYDGECSEMHCSFQITLSDFPFNLHGRYGWKTMWPGRTAMFVGGHPAVILGSITVENAIVWGKEFDVMVEAPPYAEAPGLAAVEEYTLIGTAYSVSRFRPPRWEADVSLHPNYSIGTPSGCEICVEVFSKFTPYAESRDVQRLMQFNFSCLTRWNPCRLQHDIMPAVWEEHLNDQAKMATTAPNRECGPQEVELMGRDAENAAVVDVIANRNESLDGNEKSQDSTVRLVKRLKRTAFWDVAASHELRVYESRVALAGLHPLNLVHPRARLIILFEKYETSGLVLDDCGAFPFTAENLALVNRGVEQDYQAVLQTGDAPLHAN